ncbi:MAG: hypothetical protein U0V02_21320 [Anaerolineales bacterium]
MKVRHPFLVLLVFSITSSIMACSSQPTTSIAPPATITAIPMTSYTDDTGVITVSLPSAWPDVITSPEVSESLEFPTLKASTSLRNFDILATPGVSIVVLRPMSITPEDVIRNLSNRTYTYLSKFSCESIPEKPYYDGTFDGIKTIYSNCNNTGNTVIVLTAQLAKTDLVIGIVLNSAPKQASKDIEPMFKSILASLKINSTLYPY